MGDRDLILRALPEGQRGAYPSVERTRNAPREDPLTLFEDKLVSLGGQLLPPGALTLFFARGGSVWADQDAIRFVPRKVEWAPTVWDAEIGVCLADFAVAETGTLVVAAAAGRSRLTSLAPPVNLVLLKEQNILPSLEDAFTRMPTATTVLISGTSRTADIEGVLVRGVHGPRELYVALI